MSSKGLRSIATVVKVVVPSFVLLIFINSGEKNLKRRFEQTSDLYCKVQQSSRV